MVTLKGSFQNFPQVPQSALYGSSFPWDRAVCTLVPEAIYRGSEERSESPLVESVGNLTSMLSPSTEIEPRR